MRIATMQQFLTVAVALGVGLSVLPAVLLAVEEPTTPTPPEPSAPFEAADVIPPEEMAADYAYGTVVEVSADRLVVSEYDEILGIAANVTYTVDPQAALYDVQSLAEIAVGDEVDLDYVMKDGGRMATAITVEKFSEEEGEETQTDVEGGE